jgi:hypothetical protein
MPQRHVILLHPEIMLGDWWGWSFFFQWFSTSRLLFTLSYRHFSWMQFHIVGTDVLLPHSIPFPYWKLIYLRVKTKVLMRILWNLQFPCFLILLIFRQFSIQLFTADPKVFVIPCMVTISTEFWMAIGAIEHLVNSLVNFHFNGEVAILASSHLINI